MKNNIYENMLHFDAIDRSLLFDYAYEILITLHGYFRVFSNSGAVEGLDIHKIVGAVEDLDINKIMKAVQNDANDNRKKGSPAFATEEETGESSEQIEEVTEEEVVELEFEKVKPKLDTHTMHCPNCDQHITKVVLRRKIIRRPPAAKLEQEQRDLFGCLSCFSLFTSTGTIDKCVTIFV